MILKVCGEDENLPYFSHGNKKKKIKKRCFHVSIYSVSVICSSYGETVLPLTIVWVLPCPSDVKVTTTTCGD